MLVFFTIFSFILFARASSFLFGYELLNIDESQMMANAIRLQLNGFNIFEFDGTSSGFLNSLILTWPSLLGLDITYLSTRFTALILISLTLYFCFLYLRFEVNKLISFLIISPALLLFSLTNDPDYQHYSSELLSTLFIIITLYGFRSYIETNKIYSLLIGLFLLGLVIFSKTQIIPTAIILCFSISLYFLWKKNYFMILKNLLIFFGPIAIIIFSYFLAGYLKDYYINYFEFSKAVVSKYSLGENINPKNVITENVSTKSKIFDHLLLNSVFHYFYLKIILTFYLFLLMLSFKKTKNIFNYSFFLIIISIISVLMSIIITGAIYRHYFIPLVPLTALFVGSIFTMVANILSRSFIFKIPIYFFFIIFVASFLFENKKFYAQRYEKNQFNFQKINLNSPKVLDYLGVQKGNIYIWGWAPQWYVFSYLFPSDRATISQKNIENYSNKEYFNSRLIKDLEDNKPNIIIDFVKPKSFLYTNPELGINNSPLKNLIKKKYVKLENYNPECPDIYLKSKDFEELDKKIIDFKIDNNLVKNRLNDFSITETICDDGVIFNENFPDEINLDLDPKFTPKKLLVLASKFNKKNVELKIRFQNVKNKIYTKNILLNKYPYWTEIILEENKSSTSKIIFDISELKKMRYGINEIKIFK